MLGLRISSVCILALAALMTPAAGQTPAQTVAHGPEFWAVTGVAPDDALNLRVAPNWRSRRIARIPHNARGLKNFGCPNYVTFEQWKRMTQAQKDRAQRSRWCEVEYNGKRGWVAGWFLKADDGE